MTRERFGVLAQEALPKLRNTLRKMVGNPEQVDDLAQETLEKAWNAIGTFEERAQFSTWFCAIGVRAALDFLRSQKRWRAKAQVIYANECMTRPEMGMEVGAALHDPGSEYDIQEHLAYCFTCLGRSLAPMDQACVVLKEVLGLTSAEGAKALGITESVFRHNLSSARVAMEREFEGLCALVNKKGICHQCKALREGSPEGRRGEMPVALEAGSLAWEERMAIVARAALDRGRSQKLHDLFWRRTTEIEKEGAGDESAGACHEEEAD